MLGIALASRIRRPRHKPGLAFASRTVLQGAVVLLGLLLLCGSGIAAALWQHFVAKASASCNLTLADRIVSGLRLDALLPDVFQATASCAEAAVDLAGVPYEFWSVGLFVLIEAASVVLFLHGRRAIS